MKSKATKIVENQVNRWVRNKNNKSGKSSGKSINPIITISREFGAEGAAIGKKLSEKLDFEFWHNDLLKLISEESGLDEKFLQSLDEKRQQSIKDAMMGMLKTSATNVQYLQSIIKVIKTIEMQGNSIIVGRGANYICTKPKALHVRVVRPKTKRIKSYAAKNTITEPEARRKIDEMDKEREDFVRHHFNQDVNDSSTYDIVINSGTFQQEEIMDIILKSYAQKTDMQITI